MNWLKVKEINVFVLIVHTTNVNLYKVHISPPILINCDIAFIKKTKCCLFYIHFNAYIEIWIKFRLKVITDNVRLTHLSCRNFIYRDFNES